MNLDKVEYLLENVRRYSRYISSSCPFHDDYNPSFLAYEDGYFCLSCGAKGKTKDLPQKLNGYSSGYSTPRYFRNPFTKWTKKEPLELSLIKACKNLRNNLNRYEYYLLNRGLNRELIKKMKLGYRDVYYTFPIFDRNNKFIGAVARIGDTPSKVRYVTPSGQESILYCPNYKRLENHRSVFLVYGIVDALSFEKIGLPSITGTTGKRFDPVLVQDIRKKIVIIPDFGEEKEAYKLANDLGWRGEVLIPEYPDGCKDVNDLLINHPDYLREAVHGYI